MSWGDPRESDDARGPHRLSVMIRKSAPGVAPPPPASEPPSGVDDPGDESETGFRERIILSVEDSPIHSKILTRYLEQVLECRVLQADGVESAVSALLRERPDLIVTDLMMPDLNGLDLIQIMHVREDWQTIPVIVHSAANDVSEIRALAKCGVKDYILKPFDPGVALPRLRRALASAVDAPRPSRPPADVSVADERIPIVVATTDAALGALVARTLDPMYQAITTPSGPATLLATMERTPWIVFLAPEIADWDMAKTHRALLALKSIERVHVMPLPRLDADESVLVDLIRREVGAGPFTVGVDGDNVTVTLHRSFTVACVGALRHTVQETLSDATASLVFEVPTGGLEGQALGAIQEMARGFRE